MTQKRHTTTSIVSMIIIAIVFCFMAGITVKSLQYVLHRKVAIGRVISYNVPDPKHPTTYLVKTRFFNEYKHDSIDRDVQLVSHKGGIPKNMTVYYDDKNEAYADAQQITWATVMWRSLVSLLLLGYIAMELFTFTIANNKDN